MAGERGNEALAQYRSLYGAAKRKGRSQLLDEFCRVTKYCRKYAIGLLGHPSKAPRKRQRRRSYPPAVLDLLREVWKAAGYPWSVRLKALVPIWMGWLRQRHPGLLPEEERLLLKISARQIDRILKPDKLAVRRRLYGRTKPGTLLKHQIPIKTEHWDVTEPGFVEIDLVAHCGNCASGEFVHSLNLTDIFSGWSVGRAILGRGEKAVVEALADIRRQLPFALKGIHSDNGSEFINYHLYRYCRERHLEFVRGRPYKKDDNAHIEQKNWTHVRKIFGYARFDTAAAVGAMNDLYQGDLQLMMNLFQPSVKLVSKERVGSRLRRRYDRPRTPLDRLLAWRQQQAPPGSDEIIRANKPKGGLQVVTTVNAKDHPHPDANTVLATFKRRRGTIDPFALSARIDRSLAALDALRREPKVVKPKPHPQAMSSSNSRRAA